jgi:hypothetical protein
MAVILLGVFLIDIPYCFQNPDGRVVIAHELNQISKRNGGSFGLSLSTGEALWGYGHIAEISVVPRMSYDEFVESGAFSYSSYTGIHSGDLLKIRYLPTTGLILTIETQAGNPDGEYFLLYTSTPHLVLSLVAIIAICLICIYVKPKLKPRRWRVYKGPFHPYMP